MIKERLLLDGKCPIPWVKSDMIKIKVIFLFKEDGNPCQVADIAFNHKAFEIVEAENNLPFRKNQFKSMIISIGL